MVDFTAHRLDDFSPFPNSLQFSWTGASHVTLVVAKLDRFFVNERGQARVGLFQVMVYSIMLHF